jgi:hypothetical protein
MSAVLVPRQQGTPCTHTSEDSVLKLIFFIDRLLDSPNDSWGDDLYVDDPLAS